MQKIRRSRLIAFVSLLALFAPALAATPGPARADLLEDIKKKGELVVATEARFPPFEFVEDGKIVGYSSDLMVEIMKALPGVKLTQLDLPWQGILPGLQAGKYDYVVTSVTVTPKRYEAYALSLPIADATFAVVKRKGDSAVQKPEDIAGKIVGSQAGSAQLQGLETFSKELEAQGGQGAKRIETYVDFNEAYADLAAGRLEAVVNSLPNLLFLQKQRPDVFEVVQPTFGPKKYFSWAARNDEASRSLAEFFDAELRKLNESGKMTELQRKWFGFPMEVPVDKLPKPEA